MLKVGTILRLQDGEYEIVSRIGEGNYGVVWEARRAADGLGVAVKTVQTHFPGNTVPYSSLERETLTAAVAGYEKSKEAAGRLEMAPNLESHVAELLAAVKARRDELTEARAREAEAESARAAWREIEGFLDDGEWKRAQRLFRERRQVLARHLAELFETLSGAVETLKRSQASDAEIAAAEAELNAAKETEFGRRMAAFIDAETRRAANLRAERERVRAAEARYDEIVRLTNDEKWPEAKAALDRE